MRTKILALAAATASVLAAGLVTATPASASDRAACLNADQPVRTPRWYAANRPDLSARQVQAVIALAEAFANRAVRCLVNAERAAAGRGPVEDSLKLYRAADGHVRAAKQQKWWVNGANSHVNPRTGSTPSSRIRAEGWCPSGTWRVSENTYHGWGNGFATPRAAVRWWMGSPGHRANILEAGMTHTGVSMRHGTAKPGVTHDVALVTTQVFGSCK